MSFILDMTSDERQAMVDDRVARILKALPPRDPSEGEEALIVAYLADEWACLVVAAFVVAPLFGVDVTDPAVVVRLQRAAHAALKAESERIAGEGPK